MSLRQSLIYSDGYAHPFAESSAALARLLEAQGWTVAIETELDAALARLPEAQLFAVNALRWSMVQHEKYASHRAEHARTMSDAQLAAIERFVAGGGSLLALHTAVICWDNQPGWRALLGGGWHWDRSWHPPLGPVTVTPSAAGRAAGLTAFSVTDEAYHRLDPAADCTVLACAAAGDPANGPQPVAWTRNHGSGRVAVDALGHDAASLEEAAHATLLAHLIGWLDG